MVQRELVVAFRANPSLKLDGPDRLDVCRIEVANGVQRLDLCEERARIEMLSKHGLGLGHVGRAVMVRVHEHGHSDRCW